MKMIKVRREMEHAMVRTLFLSLYLSYSYDSYYYYWTTNAKLVEVVLKYAID